MQAIQSRVEIEAVKAFCIRHFKHLVSILLIISTMADAQKPSFPSRKYWPSVKSFLSAIQQSMTLFVKYLV